MAIGCLEPAWVSFAILAFFIIIRSPDPGLRLLLREAGVLVDELVRNFGIVERLRHHLISVEAL